MVPEALLNFGSQAEQLMVEATETEHAELSELLTALKQAAQDDARSLKSYQIDRDQVQNAQSLLTAAVPGLNLRISSDGTRLMALVSDEQDVKINSTLHELATATQGTPRKKTSVFDISGTDPDSIRTALQPFSAADSSVQITVDSTSRRVYVHAYEDRQEDIREAITQIMSGVTGGGDTQVAAYFVGDGNGDEAEDALMALYPDATIVSDRSRRMIIATATPEQHERIKIVAEQLREAAIVGRGAIPKTYETTHLDTEYLESVFARLFPRDREFTATVNRETGQVVVLAKPEQHETVSEMLKQIDHESQEIAKTLKVYKTAPMTPATVIATLGPMVSRNAALSAERTGNEIIVTAPAKEHLKIAALLEQMGISAVELEKQLAMYRVSPLDTTTVINALTPLVSKHVTISPERSGQEIVVTAPPEEQEKIADLVRQIRAHRTETDGMQIRSYQLDRRQALAAISILTPMFPDARFASDRNYGILLATALPEDQETIAKVVRQMTGRGGGANQPTAKTYLMRQYDGIKVRSMLQQTFTTADDVRITWDDRNRRIIAVATAEQQELIASIVEDLDPVDGPNARRLKRYRITNLDVPAVQETIDGAIRHLDPGATIALDYSDEILLVTTHERGHRLVEETIGEFKPFAPRVLEVFQLSYLDPSEAKSAIERMISQEIHRYNSRPVIHRDEIQQQLWVRASESQIKQIRELLIKLGEVGLTESGRGNAGADANLRTIPVGNDVEGVMRRIQEQWPRLRTNPIRVMDPGRRSLDQPKSIPGQFSVPPEDLGKTESEIATERELEEAAVDADPGDLPGAAPRVDIESDDPGIVEAVQKPLEEELDPVILIPGDGRITIASDDIDALDQLESLLKTIYSQGGGPMGNRDFSIRQLRNTSATDVALVIEKILKGTRGITSFGKVAVVPEERLNALIVYGNRSDRRRIEPLLEMLDSEKFDTTRGYRTTILPLKYANATRIEDILKGIYRAQLRAGGSRSSIDIPTGVPAEVATVLRQINAAASAPLLTIEIQRETNALVIKAPQDLLNEVTQLAMKLDEATQLKRANGVTLLPLKKTSSKRVMELLGQVLK